MHWMEESVLGMIDGARTPVQVKKKLKDAGMEFEDYSGEYGYMNLRIPTPDGYVRVYMAGKEIRTQKWTMQTIRYSGIPTFEPSGRRSF